MHGDLKHNTTSLHDPKRNPPVARDVSRTPQVKAVYTDVLSPFPKEISQLEDQSVVFESTLLVPSPYRTAKQSTIFKLASGKVFRERGTERAKRERVFASCLGDLGGCRVDNRSRPAQQQQQQLQQQRCFEPHVCKLMRSVFGASSCCVRPRAALPPPALAVVLILPRVFGVFWLSLSVRRVRVAGVPKLAPCTNCLSVDVVTPDDLPGNLLFLSAEGPPPSCVVVVRACTRRSLTITLTSVNDVHFVRFFCSSLCFHGAHFLG